jgi:hexokinase
MISGMYLGEIARLIATDLIAKDILFAGQAHAVRPLPI